jgi:hypothetical protein
VLPSLMGSTFARRHVQIPAGRGKAEPDAAVPRMGPQQQTELVTLVVVIIVVARFLVRELRARTVRVSRLWIRPAFLAAITALLIVVTLRVPVESAGFALVPSLVAGGLVGLVVGFLVAYSTRVEATGQPDIVTLRGSWVTVVIWIAALALRVGARYVSTGSALSSSPAVSSGTVMLVAVAFTIFAVLVARRARQATT